MPPKRTVTPSTSSNLVDVVLVGTVVSVELT